ncbi:extracellular catalytic domain type 1 short-chain-length polyhydroxyalkanoate depolymerase [Sunxiuqinia sp. A32]|uniref:extracellular catalytic domain type 1 short-chain-length polyhydroxyalkanoate depolymerase n=1 Tax=Sunxiuqinia sp. A32 TaxID=3461496 RepID=UPI0040454840
MIKIILLLFSLLSLPSIAQSQNQGHLIEEDLTWQGIKRDYLIYLPPSFETNKTLPLLFHLHGGGGTAGGTVKLTFGEFNRLADQYGFIVVYPNAVSKNWNDGRTQNLKHGNEYIDDVGFISKIVESLIERFPIDTNRIFTAGMSNGGFMSSRLLCDRADLFRGGAILTATLSKEYLPQCDPQKPVAVLVMNGTDDKLVPYEGGQIMVFGRSRGEIISTDAFIDFWNEHNGCMQAHPKIDLPNNNQIDGTTVSIFEYSSCSPRGALTLYKINGGGHTWPGGKQYLGKKIIGNTSREINACYVIWDFFRSLD